MGRRIDRQRAGWITAVLTAALAAWGCGGVAPGDGDPPEVSQIGDCGDGQQSADESCDDGNTEAGDGCSDQCAVEIGWFCRGEPAECSETCGDGIRNEREECDGDDLGVATCSDVRPGSRPDGELSCTAQCTLNPIGCELPTCGDGELHDGEECDDGNDADTDGCVSCLQATCGDGFVFAGQEECDDGNRQNGDGCTAGCRDEICGDGVVQPDEQCEGNALITCPTSCGTVGLRQCVADSCEFGVCNPPSEICNAVDDDCNGIVDSTSCLQRVFRFYNPTTGDHMFKVNSTVPPAGYVSETSNNWFVYAQQMPGTVPVYQVTNGTDHMLSGSPTEGAQVGYSLQATIGFVATDPAKVWSAAGRLPTQLCRYYNSTNGDHFVYRELSPPPTNYVLEFCSGFAWGFQ